MRLAQAMIILTPPPAMIVALAVCVTSGCRVSPRSSVPATLPTTLPTTQGLYDSTYLETVAARVSPPAQWVAQPLKRSSRHTHQIWISPSGRTAYGVIHFGLPFPVGYDPVLWYFLREMRRQQGEAELLAKQWDPNQRTMRFVAQGGLYTIRPNLSLRGVKGWIVYAGTLRAQPIVPEELDLAERAREHTIVGQEATRETVQPDK